jgi:hypothetical protein
MPACVEKHLTDLNVILLLNMEADSCETFFTFKIIAYVYMLNVTGPAHANCLNM